MRFTIITVFLPNEITDMQLEMQQDVRPGNKPLASGFDFQSQTAVLNTSSYASQCRPSAISSRAMIMYLKDV